MKSLFLYLALAFTPFICAAENIKSPHQKRRETREKVRTEENWPHYEGCQDMPEQPFFMDDLNSSETETEATVGCGFHCQRFFSPFGLFKEATHSVLEMDFKKQLKERVLFQIDKKIVEIRLIKACVTEDKDYLIRLYKDTSSWPEVEKACQKKRDRLKNFIQKLWPDMAVHLSLVSPAALEDRILSEPSGWLDASPSHKISGLSQMPKLSPSELKRAKETYIETLTKAYKENYKFSTYSFSQYGRVASGPESDSRFKSSFTPEELRRHLKEGKSLHTGRKRLSLEDRTLLKGAIRDLQEKSKQNYFKIINEMPLLGYLDSGTPNNDQLAKAFSKIEENLREFSEKIKTKEDMDLLLSFEPVVEELLKVSQLDDEDNSPYCLIAERARLKSEQAKETKEKLLIGAMITMLAPCFMGGGISISICIAGEALLGGWDIRQASLEADYSFSRVLTGKEFEEISKLEEKQKELKMAQWMLPLLLLEAGVAIKAGKQLRKNKK